MKKKQILTLYILYEPVVVKNESVVNRKTKVIFFKVKGEQNNYSTKLVPPQRLSNIMYVCLPVYIIITIEIRIRLTFVYFPKITIYENRYCDYTKDRQVNEKNQNKQFKLN